MVIESHINGLLVILLLVFFEKCMIDKLFDVSSIAGIFLETTVQEITHLCTNKQVGWNLDLVLHDLNQLLLSGYFEWILSHHHFVHHDADGPNIYLLVVLSSLQNLWANIEGSSTKSSSQLVVLMHRPSEITQFDNILNKIKKYIVKYNILRFDISVDDSKGVNLIDSLANLFHDKCDARFRKWL